MATLSYPAIICLRKSWKQVLLLLAMSFWLPFSEPAAVALPQYTMDQKSDCVDVGFLDVPRDQVVKLTAPSKDTSTSVQVVGCRKQFSPQTLGDTLRMTLTAGSYIEDCDVALELQMNNDKVIRGCKSGSTVVPAMEAVDGKASIWLTRRQFEDRSYWVEVTVTAVRTEVAPPSGNSNTGSVGLIVGVTIGVLVFVVLLIVLCVCCYRKRQVSSRGRSKSEYNKDVGKSSLYMDTGHGYENNMAKIDYDDSFQKSPKSDRSLLCQDNNGKPKSALERFGNTASHKAQSNLVSREIDPGKREKQEERGASKIQINLGEREAAGLRNIPAQNVTRDTYADTQNQPKTPILSALHSNAKFRRSFHENEADAEERARRISDNSSFTSLSADSDNVATKKPRMPPVPKAPQRSPSPQRNGKKIAGVFRAGTSSTSSAEIERLEDDGREDRYSEKPSNHHSLKPTNRNNKTSEEKLKKEKQKVEQKHDENDDRRYREKDEKRRKHPVNEDERSGKKEDEKRQKIERITRSVDEDDDRSQTTEREYEGRFKKSASGRKPKGKGQRMGRSKSTGNALEDLDSSSQRSHPKSTGSVRSLILADDDIDDELDSNYTSFKRSGSKTSLYASRSSLYGRRRKNSMGETVSMSSYMHDDLDSRLGDFDNRSHLSHKEKERLFKSTGDLDISSTSAVVFRECSTQTGSSKEVYIYGRKTVAVSRPRKRYSRGTQTISGRERRDSTASARSGKSSRSNRLKSRSKSQESLRKKKSSRSRDYSDDDISERSHRQRHKKSQDRNYSDDDVSERSHRQRRKKSKDRNYSDDDISETSHRQRRKKSQGKYYSDDDLSERSGRQRRKKLEDSEDEDSKSHNYSESGFSDSDKESKHSQANRSKQKTKPNPKPRNKFQSTASNDFSDSDDNKSAVTSSSINEQFAHAQHFVPAGYPMVYPQPGVAYMSTAPGGPPMMFPVASMPQPAAQQKPSIAPKPNVSKWDQLVNLTEGMKKRRHQMGESLDTESVLSSTWSQPVMYASQPQTHYSQSPYTVAQRMPGSSSTYQESVDITKLPRERNIIGYSNNYADSNV